jgi:hypothetical protein
MTDIGSLLVAFVIVLEKYFLAGSSELVGVGLCWPTALVMAAIISGDNSD